MANPSTYYQWEFPLPGDDPWYAKFDRLISNIDLSVHSLEMLMRQINKTTLVWSFSPGKMETYRSNVPAPSQLIDGDPRFDNWTLTVSESIPPDASSSFVMSMSPIGPLIGTFTVPFSGARVRLRMHAPCYPNVYATSYDDNPTDQVDPGILGTRGGVVMNYRLIDGTQINTVNMTGDSMWVHDYTFATGVEYPIFTSIVSLDVGNYNVELQARTWNHGVSPATLGTYGYAGLWQLFATVEI